MFLNARILDNGLSVLSIEGTRLDICKSEPATYAQATSTFSIGFKLLPSISTPQDMASPLGRKVVVAPIVDGLSTDSSTGLADDAQFWAISDTSNSRLLAAGDLAETELFILGKGFTLASFEIGFRYPS
jgi:hypothetical protein